MGIFVVPFSLEMIMCEINPKHSLFFRLKAFTSNPDMTKEEFQVEVMTRVLEAEHMLNEDGRFRFHINETEDTREVEDEDCVCGHAYEEHRAVHGNDPKDCQIGECQCEEWSPNN